MIGGKRVPLDFSRQGGLNEAFKIQIRAKMTEFDPLTFLTHYHPNSEKPMLGPENPPRKSVREKWREKDKQ